jgi:cytochrome c oxidase cbb3-type subunit 2
MKIIAEPKLEKYITRSSDSKLKLTTHLLLLQKPKEKQDQTKLQEEWKKAHPNWETENLALPAFDIYELFEPGTQEAFSVAATDRILEDWVEQDFEILDPSQTWHKEKGVIYVANPVEYKIASYTFADKPGWRFDPVNGEPLKDLKELQSHPLGFHSRKELIAHGEHLYAIEGCWYCHTDQTRTLVQDVVLNGSDSYPAPPSSANEYIYQKITFPGTRRIGPDLSRTGIKRPSRDWHKAHFWAPKTQSKGSVMPSFKHLFDQDPRGTAIRGTAESGTGIPNYDFEALFQYLMTKGTRLGPPTEAWWLGKDPLQTLDLIEGRKEG